MGWESIDSIRELVGKTMVKVETYNHDEELHFYSEDGNHYKMFHSQDCCEHVRLEDVVGDLDDLVGSMIVSAYEVTNEDKIKGYLSESHTWTFYHIATHKGTVTLRWLGESNGYYSESVDFVRVSDNTRSFLGGIRLGMRDNFRLDITKKFFNL